MQALYLYFVFDIFDTDVDQIPSHADIIYISQLSGGAYALNMSQFIFKIYVRQTCGVYSKPHWTWIGISVFIVQTNNMARV